MFDTLADRIRQDEAETTTRSQRIIRIVSVIAIAFLLFGGLYLGVQFLEG